ncbi:MAG: DNA/RNA nuclease SfsA [Theionarchaea archaeon]|nr:DNA/RNA nuclease SfsA [Theionarchaea archaeon]
MMTSILIGHNLVQAHFMERKNRFLCIVDLEGEFIEVHLHDPGRLKELLLPGVGVVLRREKSPHRKTGYDMVGIFQKDILISCDSRVPNRLVQRGLEERAFPELPAYSTIVPEFTYGNSRLDFCLDSTILLEVKGVTLVTGNHALFPDAPTKRGRKHLETLIDAAQIGFKSYIMFLIQRPDAVSFSPNTRTDPQFTEALVRAAHEHVTILAYTSEFKGNCMYLGDPISAIQLLGMD